MSTLPLRRHFSALAMLAVMGILGASFWYSGAWLKLCYGLALFLFGMQCIEEGLHSAAGGTLERLMTKSTATPYKGFLFGMGATFVLQSSTLVSLLTIAFLSTGMVSLAGGIAIILGTNLGATTGIWLLALAGQSVSLSPFAVVMLVFGILAGFFGGQSKAFGRILIGIALIFMGIDAIKAGFGSFGSQVDFSALAFGGALRVLVFFGIGFLLTCILQSTHATLILTLAALAGNQIDLYQAFAIAIGSNLGSSATTTLMGLIGSDRSGQRLALVHLCFNGITAFLSLILWLPMTKLVTLIADELSLSKLVALALFHTLFNVFGVLVFWGWQKRLAMLLMRWLPDRPTAMLLPRGIDVVMPRYLDANALLSNDIALRAVSKEIGHLATLSLEVVCHAIFVPSQALYQHSPAPKDSSEPKSSLEPTTNTPADQKDYHPANRPPRKNIELALPKGGLDTDVQALYEWQIKPLYSQILDFTSKMDIDEQSSRQEELTALHIIAFGLLGIVKDSKHLQKNMSHYLSLIPDQNPEQSASQTTAHQEYRQLRWHLYQSLCMFVMARQIAHDSPAWQAHLERVNAHNEALETMRDEVLYALRIGALDSLQASSLMNDFNYVRRIEQNLTEMLTQAGEIFGYQPKK